MDRQRIEARSTYSEAGALTATSSGRLPPLWKIQRRVRASSSSHEVSSTERVKMGKISTLTKKDGSEQGYTVERGARKRERRLKSMKGRVAAVPLGGL